MPFKYFLFRSCAAVLLPLPLFSLMGCENQNPTEKDEYNIGSPLSAVAQVSTTKGLENKTFVIFDEHLRKIHQFDSGSLRKIRTVAVQDPTRDHYVLQDFGGNYIIDLSLKGFSIFTKSSQSMRNPLLLNGKPKSAAFDPLSGTLIVYDDLMNVGILRLNSEGEILPNSKAVFGPLLNERTIVAGELMLSGLLVLSLSDGSLAEVDVLASLAAQEWVFSQVNTSFRDITWLARVPSNSGRIFVKHSSGLALLDLADGHSISSVQTADNFQKLSKSIDPHAISRRSGSHTEYDFYYTDGVTIRSRQIYRKIDSLMDSHLDLQKDIWLYVEGSNRRTYDFLSNDINIEHVNRRLNVMAPSTLFARDSLSLPDRTQIHLANDFYFALYPSDLGRAYRLDLSDGKRTEVDGFNVREY